jgi:ribosomal protein S18 acetylase RimI-like enzyme
MSNVVGSKIRRNIQDYGWLTTGKKTVAHLLRPLYFHVVYRLARIDLDKPRQELCEACQSLTFKVLTLEDKTAICQIKNMAEWLRGDLEAKIGSGSLCFVALNHEEVAAFNLVSFEKIFVPLLSRSWALRAKEAWVEHIAVKKNYRRKGLGTTLSCYMLKQLEYHGFKHVYEGMLTSNLASQKHARKVGFRVLVDVHYRELMGWQSWHYKRRREWI